MDERRKGKEEEETASELQTQSASSNKKEAKVGETKSKSGAAVG